MAGSSPVKACCIPSAGGSVESKPVPDVQSPQRKRSETSGVMSSYRWCDIPAGRFVMGNDGPDANAGDGEGPTRQVFLDAFSIAATTVSNAQFAAFVRATQYVTDAEQAGNSFVFYLQVPEAQRRQARQVVSGLPWWLQVADASWQRPEGPHSHVHDRPDHPVVHVSWNDVKAYCDWAGVCLPTEEQWERAARGGLDGCRFAWGDDLCDATGSPRCNIFRGDFPNHPQAGWHPGPVAVDAGEQNGFGLFNVCGNVWEWCSNAVAQGMFPLRGGSFLCHDSYCNRYRVAARTFNSPTSSASNIGFRVASK